jgi:phospholipase/carboxylesterase
MVGDTFSFIHRFEPAQRPGLTPLLLLHGTGGNEDDLLPLGRLLSPGAALLSPLGKVRENGMPRFFRRLAEGVFDHEDLRARADELAAFVEQASEVYGLAPPLAVGYSNGANIAAAVLLLKPDALAGAVLLRATAPFPERPPSVGPIGKPILILSGRRDPLVAAAGAARLTAMLEETGALVQHETVPAGHELSPADVNIARDWVAAHAADTTAS